LIKRTTNFFINAKHWLDITGNSGGLILKPNEAEYLANQIREIETENETIFDAYQHMKWLFSALMSPNDLNYVLDIMGFTWLLYLNSKGLCASSFH
jgi:hypothetical protein